MEHPVGRCAGVAKLPNHLIREPAECFFLDFPWFPPITGIYQRSGRLSVTLISVVILPVGHAPQRKPNRGPPPFKEHPGL
jgi:hypothetical protein